MITGKWHKGGMIIIGGYMSRRNNATTTGVEQLVVKILNKGTKAGVGNIIKG